MSKFDPSPSTLRLRLHTITAFSIIRCFPTLSCSRPPRGIVVRLLRCQCFFTAEKFKPGRGVQLDAFDAKFRCPATVGCILEAPEGPEDLSSDSLSDGWKNDAACPFGSCEFDSAGGDRAVVSCKGSSFKANVWDFTIGAYLDIEACELHPGAEFCVRSSDATSDGSDADNLGNQVYVRPTL